MVLRTHTKDPDARLDYPLQWDEWLPTGDSIVASTWACDDPALVLEDSEIAGTITVIWISGGVLGQTYIVTNRITTFDGPRIDDRSLKIKIRSR